MIAINQLSGGVSCTIVAGIFKVSVSNTIPIKAENQHYTSVMIVYEKE